MAGASLLPAVLFTPIHEDGLNSVAEQLAWWQAQGFTPREALQALGVRGKGIRDARFHTWERVEHWAAQRQREMDWILADRELRRAA